MHTFIVRLAQVLFITSLSLIMHNVFADGTPSKNFVKGIYISQTTLEDTDYFNYLIKNAKSVGINTFVIDLDIPSKRYQKNIAFLKQNNIRYIARIVMFPGGGTEQQITSEAYWKRKYKLVTAAINYGANEIQLDYIRYNTKSGSSPEHSKNIIKIIAWYKKQLADKNIPLQIDVFGISSYGEETHIGQNIVSMSKTIDALCPMVYPSHYVPFKEHAATPYKTVYDSLNSIKDQFPNKMPIKLVPYIELSNYHYMLSHSKRLDYIDAQIKAAQDAGADGWYAWSANNRYDILFELMGAGTDSLQQKIANNVSHSPETTAPSLKHYVMTALIKLTIRHVFFDNATGFLN